MIMPPHHAARAPRRLPDPPQRRPATHHDAIANLDVDDPIRSIVPLGRWYSLSLSFNSDRHKMRYSRSASLTHHFRGQHQKALAGLPTPI
jgi:hypothetical protein